jgi:hypothetical protein
MFVAGMAGSAHAASDAPVPRMTGARLVAQFQGEPGVAPTQQTPQKLAEMQLADGYLAGVADSTQGRLWCDRGAVKRDEINSMVFAELSKLPAEVLQQSAAVLATRVLVRQFPCAKPQGAKT